jgi:hypothetical protein
VPLLVAGAAAALTFATLKCVSPADASWSYPGLNGIGERLSDTHPGCVCIPGWLRWDRLYSSLPEYGLCRTAIPTPSTTRTPEPPPAWDPESRQRVCNAIEALEIAESQADSLRRHVEGANWTRALALAQVVQEQGLAASEELRPLLGIYSPARFLPAFDAVETLAAAASNYVFGASEVRMDIRVGDFGGALVSITTLDPTMISFPPMQDEIDRLEATFGPC